MWIVLRLPDVACDLFCRRHVWKHENDSSWSFINFIFYYWLSNKIGWCNIIIEKDQLWQS